MKNWSTNRDVILFLSGILGVIHETVIATAERPTLLILFAAMMGLPAFLQQGKDSPQVEAPASAESGANETSK